MSDFIKTPETSPGTREAQQLRSTVDTIRNGYQSLDVVADRNLQMGTDAEVAAFYGYTDVQDATDMKALVASALGELDAAPFFQQLISRLG